jgi:mono/diheme cytochrome c family protein
MKKKIKQTVGFAVIAFVATCIVATHNAVARDKAEPAATPERFDYAELARVPKRARDRRNPQEGNPESVLIGKKLFAQHCAECHEPDARGGKKAPSLRASEVQEATPGSIFWILTNGVVRRGMPVWSKLPEPQRWALVTYVKSLKAAASIESVDGSATK